MNRFLTAKMGTVAKSTKLKMICLGTVGAQGTLNEMKGIQEIETGENKDSGTAQTNKERKDSETEKDLAKVQRLGEAEEEREVGSVSFKVDAKYFMFGAPALVLLLILLTIIAGQG